MLSHLVIARSTLKPTRLDLREHAALSCRVFRMKQKLRGLLGSVKAMFVKTA